MAMDREALYLQLGQLVAEMPVLSGNAPITADMHRWLARASVLVGEAAPQIDTDSIAFTIASDGLGSVLRENNAHKIASIVHRALARAEANAPAAARGAFIAVGAGFDALQAIAKVLAEARAEVLIVDPYMDAKVLTDFAVMAPEGVAIHLLPDSFSTKPAAVLPAAERWVQQFGAARPLGLRMADPRTLHDRLMIIDGATVWSLTQSLKDFAGRSPASVLRVGPELARMKAEFYAQLWVRSAQLL